MITIKSTREIELMREAGKILAEVHERLGEMVKPGVTTWEIDKKGEELIRKHGCIAQQYTPSQRVQTGG